MKGMAADIHLNEISELAVRDYLLALHCGGVGFYPALQFVHVDVGPVRVWSEPAGRRRLVGERPITVITKVNDYRVGETIHWRVIKGRVLRTMILQKFTRGQWEDIRQIDLSKVARLSLPDWSYGKYRLRTVSGPTAYSNEFYLKAQ